MSPQLPVKGTMHDKRRDRPAQPEQTLAADAARDGCLAMVAHELKQPLSVLLLNLGMLLEKMAELDVGGAQELGQAMRHSIRRQARIIDDLFDLSRMRMGKFRLAPELLDLDEVAHAIAADVAFGTPERDVRVDVDTSARHWCMADRVRLEQMLSNLLDNAVKFSARGGRIRVRVAGADGFATVSVSDDGCGISAEFLPHVFRMFGQERGRDQAARPGMGIGLALVQELARAHGGRVEAQSEGPGCGASFTLWLPMPGSAAGLLSIPPSGANALSMPSPGA